MLFNSNHKKINDENFKNVSSCLKYVKLSKLIPKSCSSTLEVKINNLVEQMPITTTMS